MKTYKTYDVSLSSIYLTELAKLTLMNAHVKDYAKKRLKGWQINESVWGWIVRKTDIKPTIGGIDELAKAYNVNRNTLRTLKKTQQCSMTEHTRKQLAKYSFKIPEVEGTCNLDDYGYPSGHKYVEPESVSRKDSTSTQTYSSGASHRKRAVAQHHQKRELSQEQKAINDRISSDFNDIVNLSESTYGICQFCQPVDFNLKSDVNATSKNCKLISLSTHKHKRYGPASIAFGKGFELEVKICEKCLKRHKIIFLIPISSLIKKIMLLYRLSQNILAEELKGPGVTAKISRLLNDKTDFIDLDFLRKLYGIYLLGPNIHYYKNEHLRLLMLAVDHHAGIISREVMFDKMEVEPAPWEAYPNFLLEGDFVSEGLIAEPEDYEKYHNYSGGSELNVKILSSEFIGSYFDSNKVSLEYEVKYEVVVTINVPDVEERVLDEGVLKVEHLLIDIKNREIADFYLN